MEEAEEKEIDRWAQTLIELAGDRCNDLKNAQKFDHHVCF
jgi:hypothetical protein